ncbi:hypothetical protein FRC09_004078 [Ceratobasidium sp. 395]|nr:hypothetical protein FRC09_004078 [Ceratobasidium sp. 395]
MPSGSESDEETGSEDEVQPPTRSERRIKGGRTWKHWESLVVVEKACEHKPWELKELAERCRAWDRIATELQDEYEGFNWSGTSCLVRFDRMLSTYGADSSEEDSDGESTAEGQHIQRAESRELRSRVLRASVTHEELSEGVQNERQRKRPPPSPNPSSSSGSPIRFKRFRSSAEAESLDEASVASKAKEEVHHGELEAARDEEQARHEEIIEGLRGVTEAINGLTDAISGDRQDTRTLLKVVDKLVTR